MAKRHGFSTWSAESGCNGKVRFDSFKQAADVNQARGKGRNHNRRGVYNCPACHGFHIGRRSKLKPDVRKRNERLRDIEQSHELDEELTTA